MLTTTNWPGQCTLVRMRHTPVPGATPRPPPPRGNTQPSFRRASTGERIHGTIRGQPGSRWPQPLAWEHANGSSRGTMAGLPTTVRNLSAYDSSAAEGDPSDRHPRGRSRGKRHRREALSSPSKRRKTSHSPVWHPSSSSSKSEVTESRGTPPSGESSDSRNVDSTMSPLDASDSLTVSDGSSFTAQDLQLLSTPLPPRPIRTRASGHPPRETRKGSILSLSLQWRRGEKIPLPRSST